MLDEAVTIIDTLLTGAGEEGGPWRENFDD